MYFVVDIVTCVLEYGIAFMHSAPADDEHSVLLNSSELLAAVHLTNKRECSVEEGSIFIQTEYRM
jgi:hypothetical protein